MADKSTAGPSSADYAKSMGGWTRSGYKGPTLLLSGEPAARATARILLNPTVLTTRSALGIVTLVAGTMWAGNKMLLAAQSMTVLWVVEDRIYEWGTQDFIRCEWMDAIANGAARAEGMRRFTRIETELLAGLFVPFYLILGSSLTKSAVLYYAHQRAFVAIKENLQGLVAEMAKIERTFPALYKMIRSSVLRELLLNFPNGIAAEDVAFFVGRMIRGVSGAVDALEIGQRLTVSAILRTAGVFATLVAVTHSPSILAQGGEQAMRDLLKRINEIGAGVAPNETELRQIVREIQQQPEVRGVLERIRTTLDALAPALTELSKAYKENK